MPHLFNYKTVVMIQFNKVLFLKDTGLYVDVQIMNSSYFTDVYLKDISIYTETTYGSDTVVYSKTFDSNTKSYASPIAISEFTSATNTNFNNHLYILKVTAIGTPSSTTPCGLDSATEYSFAFNQQGFIESGLAILNNTCTNGCEIPKYFIDYYLKFRALLLSIDSKDITYVIKYFNKFMSYADESGEIPSINTCGCHG